MTNSRKAKRNKESSLRHIIDKRKDQKASAPAVEEMDLTANNADVVSLDKESTTSVLMFFKEELLAGIKQGMDEELKSLDSETRQRLDATGIIKELYEGIKQGINEELKQYIADSSKTLTDTMQGLVSKLDDTLNTFNGTPTSTPVEIPAQPQPTRSISDLSASSQESIASQYLGREKLTGTAPTTFGGKAKEFATRVAFGTLGFQKYAEDRIQKKRSLDFTVKAETELNPERFKGMSKRKIVKTIEQDQKQREAVRKKLAENESHVSQLRRAGYSDDDVKKMGYEAKRGDILQDAVRADSGTRLGAQFDSKTAIGSDVKAALPIPQSEEDKAEATRVQEQSLKQEEEQIDLLKNIRDLLDKKDSPEDNSAKVPAQPQQSMMDKALDVAGDLIPDRVGKKKPDSKGKGKLSKGLNIAKNLAKGAVVLGAGMSVVGGVSDVLDGKKIENVGDIVPEGLDVINPAAWAMNGGRYVGDKINAGVEAVAGQGLGGWLYDKVNGSPTEQLNAKTMIPSKTGERIANKVTAEKVEEKKQPIINVPPPTVINKGGGEKVVMPPFNTNMRNTESSLSAYLRSRY